MVQKEELYWHQKLFLYTLYFSWFLYALSLIVYFSFHVLPIYSEIDRFIKLYIGTILVYKFNPFFGKGNFTYFDRKLAWHAGFYLLISSIVSPRITSIFENMKDDTNYILNKYVLNNLNSGKLSK